MKTSTTRSRFSKKPFLTLVTAALLISTFIGCNNAEEEKAVAQYTYKAAPLPPQVNETAIIEEPTPQTTTETKPAKHRKTTVPGILSATHEMDSTGLTHVKYAISQAKIDSLNKILPNFDPQKYNRTSVTYFTSMAGALGGRAYFADNSDSITNAIMDILSTRLNDGTDIVFLIDKTGSMDDDIAQVKNSMNLIMDYLSNFQNVKVGIAAYGDKNYHYDLWYNKVDLSSDINQLRDFMDSYSTIGNADIPESVNDAIVRTANEMNWTPGNRRLMLVIGDAPSQEPPLSDYSSQEVIAKCDSMNIQFNLYPIIIATGQAEQVDNYKKKDFLKLYPNPANTFTNIDFYEEGTYYYELDDMTGKKVQQGNATGKTIALNLNDIPNGTYLIQVYDGSITNYFSTPFIVQH